MKAHGMARTLLLAAAMVTAFISAAVADTKVSWTPVSVSFSLPAGQSTKTTATLNIIAPVGNANLRVTPSLAQFITVSPSAIAGAVPGQMIPITITATLRQNAPSQLFGGVIQVRTTNPNAVLARPLQVNLLVQDTLAGVDADNNGVWDYIDAYIQSTFTDDATKAAARQFARGIEAAILNATDKSASITNASAVNRGLECMFSIQGMGADKTLKGLEAHILNTKARANAYLLYNSQLGGQIFQLADDFSKSCLPNQ